MDRNEKCHNCHTWCLKKNDRNIRKCNNLNIPNHDELFNIWHTKTISFNGFFKCSIIEKQWPIKVY